MADDEFVELFRRSLLGVPAALNEHRADFGHAPLESLRTLNFNAYDHACHLMKAGLSDDSPLVDTVRPFKGQDISKSVALVRQWPVIKEAGEYLFPWTRDELANSVLLGDYKYMGIAGDIVALDTDTKPFYRAIVVLVLTTER